MSTRGFSFKGLVDYVLALKDSLTSMIGSLTAADVGVSNPNLFVNGDFSIWQRGGSNTSGGYCADRWRVRPVSHSGGSIAIVHLAASGGVGSYLSLSTTNLESYTFIEQRVESLAPDDLYGDLTVSFDCTLDMSLPNAAISVQWMEVGTEARVSPLVQAPCPLGRGANAVAKTLSVPEITNFDTKKRYALIIQTNTVDAPSDGRLRFWRMKAERGSVATPFIPDDPAINLMRCQKYYQNSTGKSFPHNLNSDGSGFGQLVLFKTTPSGWYDTLRSGSTVFSPPLRGTPTLRFADARGNIGKLTQVHTGSNIEPISGNPFGSFSNQGFSPDIKTNPNTVMGFQWEADAEI